MTRIRRHSATAQVAYHDLVSLLLDDTVSDIRGAPTVRERNGRRYWYDRYRIGTETHERYLGEDTPELAGRIERHRALDGERRQRGRERARLVRLLRSERYLGLDGATGSLVAALARTGVFRLGGVLVGTIAFRLYEGELGLRLSLDELAMTNDIDVASFEKLSLAIGDTVTPAIADALAELDFNPEPSLQNERIWRWKQSPGETFVEFLTPSFDDEEALREYAADGVSPRSLHFLNYLIADPLHAAAIYREGLQVRVPRPERFAIHTLIVADRRREGPDSARARKDIMQARLLVTALAEDRPADLRDAYEDALERGPRWRERLQRSLGRNPDLAALLRSLE